jgi:aspartate carbamoyltransferase catalytic subunit
MQHILEAQQFNKKSITELFDLAEKMERVVANGGNDDLHGKIMATLFYSISTRTRLSFESAMHRLGGSVISTEHPQLFSDVAGGSSLEDTIRMVGSYADVIVLRHPDEGAASRAAAVAGVSVINAGDGGGQHPTQALLDLYTIHRATGGIDGASVVVMGDLANSQTIRSLCYFLGKYTGIKLSLASPPGFAMRPDIIEYLQRHHVPVTQVFDPGPQLVAAIGRADVVYQTELPQGTTGDDLAPAFGINKELLGHMKQRAIIMHPFPRAAGIAHEIDDDPRALYFQQITNGLFIRMALLKMLI